MTATAETGHIMVFDESSTIFKNVNVSAGESIVEKVYVYKDLHLVVRPNAHSKDQEKTHKKCYIVEQTNNVIKDGVLIIETSITQVPIEKFPFVNKYDRVISRTFINNGPRRIVKERDCDTGETITMMEIKKIDSDLTIHQVFNMVSHQ